SLQNRLYRDKIQREIVTIITQVEVNKDDPELANPSKFIGQFYSEQEAVLFQTERGWVMKEDSNRGWRRVVASPIPQKIVEGRIIAQLVDSGVIVIAAGGGGIPVYVEKDGTLEGVDAVIDKDRASALLANQILAEMLIILTNIEKVAVNFGKPNQKLIDEMTASEAQEYLRQGHFPPGSMGPKIEAAIDFLRNGGTKVVVSSIEKAADAVFGNAGTVITRG
ncbi:MAG: carbamate kinase, partial [candidate division Zixibacteria bacterium]|nr:carbamate kinase [candidate division Zixibacteria bacterium]